MASCLQVLLALQKLVNALGPESPGCYPLLLPILQHSLDISQVSKLNCMGRHYWGSCDDDKSVAASLCS